MQYFKSLCITLAVLALALAGSTAFAAATTAAAPSAMVNDDFPDSTEVAVVGGQHFTLGQLPLDTAIKLGQTKRRVEQQKRQLDIESARARQKIIETQASALLDERVLRMEADVAHKTQDQLIKELGGPKVDEAAVQSFYDQHSQQINQPFEAVREKIRSLLTQQSEEATRRSYLDSLRTKYSARITIEPLREPVAATGPSRGSDKAGITIVEFADFQCPYCAQMEPVLAQVLARYPNDVRLVYRYLPLIGVHPDAMHAADAGVCAAEQGRFWEMHDTLFANQAALSNAELYKAADRLKLDAPAFKVCMSSAKTEAAVSADANAGEEAGVTGTPGLFINGRFFDGALSFERLASVIDDELWRRGRLATQIKSAAAGAASPIGR